MNKKLIFTLLVVAISQLSFAQNSRSHHHNSIGWYNYFGTFKLSEKWGVHTEYQFRREELITNWQQGLLRVGLNYNINPRVLVRVGYAWAETYPYGDVPLNGMGKDFTEHRTYEMLQLSHKEGSVDISHRFMLEQRFIGRYSNVNLTTEDEFPFSNRARYMIRVQMPLKGKEMKDKTPYIAVYDEIIIGFGENVNANIFDQNRLGVALGYRFNKGLRVEAGYLNQTIQFGRLINGKNVIQNNNGLVLSANFNFDLTK
jgi:opacity protein-like surface antigen